MTISEINCPETSPIRATIKGDRLFVDLADGRSISVPLSWYPRLQNGTKAELANIELLEDALHWEDLNEIIGVKSLLLGKKSGEGRKSFARWMSYRSRGQREPILTLPLPPEMTRPRATYGVQKQKRKSKTGRVRSLSVSRLANS